MSRTRPDCADIEQDLIAAAVGEADPAARRRVEDHVARCTPCGGELRQYRAIDGALDTWREVPLPAAAVRRARKRLESELERLRHRLLTYRVFPSPLGNILIAVSDRGVSLLEYLGRARNVDRSRLAHLDLEAQEDGADLERLYRELIEYLEGRRRRLEWPLDLRLARSEFHRAVLRITSGIPYGAVMSYAAVACALGRPAATRAVAQALRWNPVPIVVPCHRVIGTSGALTGYAGNRVNLKERLLATEGIRIERADRTLRVPREAMYVRTTDGGSYCLPSCAWLRRVRHANRLVLFGSREGAEAAGLRPCGDCRPDLHPLTS